MCAHDQVNGPGGPRLMGAFHYSRVWSASGIFAMVRLHHRMLTSDTSGTMRRRQRRHRPELPPFATIPTTLQVRNASRTYQTK